jgi:putative transposase
VTIACKRDAVRFLATKGVSVRRACQLTQLERATFHYQARSRPDEAVVLADITQLAQQHPRYGYRRVWALLRRKRIINRKRVHRLWKRTRLQVKRPIRRRARRNRPAPQSAAYPNHVWAYDFVEDHALDGSTLRILTVMDEFTREGLDIDVDTSSSADRVISRLEELVAQYGAPTYLRSDNGPEFVAVAVQRWLAQRQIATLYVDPGCPWQNGKEERFNGTVRDECLNMHAFASAIEASVRLKAFRHHYNQERPHSALRYQTPSEFKRAWVAAQQKADDPNIAT